MDNEKRLKEYADCLCLRELAGATIEIYVRQAGLFLDFVGDQDITKEILLSYKKKLQNSTHQATTLNLYIIAVNSYLKYAGYPSLLLRTRRIQRRCLSNVLTLAEYHRLVNYAKDSGREKYAYLFQVLAQTGMRISELKFLTVEALEEGRFMVENKGKSREIYLTDKIYTGLKEYCERNQIISGPVFLNPKGAPLGRNAVNKMMKQIASETDIPVEKLYPHNLRHLFAVTYINKYGNLMELADLMGHSSLETTRIYTVSNAEERQKRLEALPL